MTRIVWNSAELSRLLTSPGGEVLLDLERRATNVESQAKLNASGQNGGPRVRTGRLRSSITHQIEVDDRGPVARIGSNVEYALYVEEGTPAHRIVPRRRKALHWPGAQHPVMSVNHPGSRPYPYLRPALAAALL